MAQALPTLTDLEPLAAWSGLCSTAKVWIPIFAGVHELRVDRRQGLCGSSALRTVRHDRPDAIHDDPAAHAGSVGNETGLATSFSDLGTRPPWP
jgi:hypothetical protein